MPQTTFSYHHIKMKITLSALTTTTTQKGYNNEKLKKIKKRKFDLAHFSSIDGFDS